MKVLHVESGRHLYGGARQVLYLLEALRGSGVESVLACAAGSDVERAGRAQGERVCALPMHGDLDPLLFFRLLRLIRAERPAIVHLHSRRSADVQGGLAAAAAGVPAVLSRRVDHPPSPLLARWQFGLYDRVIAISEEIRRVLLAANVPAERVVCVPSAVDLARFARPAGRAHARAALGVGADDAVIGVVAQLIERKGHRFLLDAFPAIRAAAPQARLLFLGRGPLEPELRAQAGRQGLADRVHFAGFREDLPDLYPALDVVAHPATAEGLGVALLEAAAAERPIVASAVGGIPEIVRDGETGLLVPPRDSAALGSAIVRLLLDGELARRLGAGARALVAERHSVAAMTAGNLAVYRTVRESRP
jgi:glycosyltransferase involved in cell wall biosynthesis